MGFKQWLFRLYAWLKHISDSYKLWATQREEDKRINREQEVAMLTQEAEMLESQLETLRIENELANERRRLRNT